MARDPQGRFDLTRISQQLGGEGYVVLEGLLDSSRLTEWRSLIDRLGRTPVSLPAGLPSWATGRFIPETRK